MFTLAAVTLNMNDNIHSPHGENVNNNIESVKCISHSPHKQRKIIKANFH